MTKHSEHARRGFSLVELLVTIAVIGVLVAMLLPAISAAREAARRGSCANNLKQIGLALHSHENIHRAFPIGARSSAFEAGVSWWVDLTPFFEETAVYCQLDRQGSSAGTLAFNPQNGEVVDQLVIGVMSCPSSPLEKLFPVSGYQVMMPSYVGISGSSSRDGFPESRVSPCCLFSDGEISAGGVLIANRAVRLKQISDGCSHTLVVGECSDYAVDPSGVLRRVDGGISNGWIAGTIEHGTPPTYCTGSTGNPRPSWNITTVQYGPNMRDYSQPGIYTNRGANNPLLSAHGGGVTGLYADGSVHLIADDVGILLLKNLATRDDGVLLAQNE